MHAFCKSRWVRRGVAPRVVARAGEAPWLLVVSPVGWAQAKGPFP